MVRQEGSLPDCHRFRILLYKIFRNYLILEGWIVGLDIEMIK